MAASSIPLQGEAADQLAQHVAAAVRIVFDRWTALQLAVDHQWGGAESPAKVAAFADSACRLVFSTQRVYFDQFADLLDSTLLDEFATQAEDDSVEEVAERLQNIHDEWRVGHAPTALAMLASAQQQPAQRETTLAMCKAGAGIGDEDDDLVDDNGDQHSLPGGEAQGLALHAQSSPTAMDADAQTAEQPPPRPEPVIDDDGFELVPARRRR